QKTHQGFFRHLVIREGVNTGQLMVNLSVCLANLNKEQTNIWEDLLGKFKQENHLTEQITTFVITNNTGLADTVKNETSETKVFWGDGYIHETLNFDEVSYITFRISPFSFFQTNTHGAEKLFSTAFAMLGNWEGNILDLYCGTGSIGLSLLKMRKNLKSDQALIGIEIVEDAIRDARMNAKINGLEDQTFFIASPAEKALEKAPELTEKIKNLGVVVIDPPRDGLHNNVIEWIVNLKKESDFKLLYISCNPVTMARDVELFLERGFVLKEIQPVDMFPLTHHIECVGVLQ
ncbi:MAG: methyltransferase domain-containing protein, partial [Candidatus Peribacteria bacterium]|nr:methyltransferase domain-containing protein [Candidatus Peribacteria bacterium]